MHEDTSLLEKLHSQLSWPAVQDILAPAGAGPAEFARLAREKLEVQLRHQAKDDRLRVGVLVADPCSSETSTLLAIVCVFPRPVSEEVLQQAHRLAWNFCRSPLLVTLEPHQLRAWSCFVAPQDVAAPTPSANSAELIDLRSDPSASVSLARQAANVLQWVSLAAGEVFRQHPTKFRPEGRADRTLLHNLKHVRQCLMQEEPGKPKLGLDLAHDLIARLIFIQFLFDRTDKSGRSVLNREVLEGLHTQGWLKHRHSQLSTLLSDYDDAYGLFRWLNERFNGDLFPAKSPDPAERELQWKEEQTKVKPHHLELLGAFVAGKVDFSDRQLRLWRLYSFNVIPLEFISSVYEEFVSKVEGKKGVHYTPIHLVDFVLDSALPWDGDEWELRILDPACGSGIFLVRAFQRLVHRWRRAHVGSNPPFAVLRSLLENNLFGIDINEHAVRVASFSLYLALCDEVDPRDYVNDVQLPILRGRRLISSDFFKEGIQGFDTVADMNSYDLAVGNAPWGKNTATAEATTWSTEHGWPLTNGDISTLFMAKAAQLVRNGGRITLIQPAGTLLQNRWSKAIETRKKLFATYKVEEVANFAILRKHLFPTAKSPSCSVTFQKAPPDGSPIIYICPKLLHTGEDQFRIAVDACDIHAVYPEEADDPWIWTVLLVGGRRDLSLVRRMAKSPGTTLKELKSGMNLVDLQEGLMPDPEAPLNDRLRNRRLLASSEFPPDVEFTLDASGLPLASEVRARWNTNPDIFDPPQLIIKQAWSEARWRFQAAMVKPDPNHGGAVCTQSYISVHGILPAAKPWLEAACTIFNSRWAAYYLLLTSGRTPFIPEPLAGDFYDFPLPRPPVDNVFPPATLEAADNMVATWFNLTEVDSILAEDALKYGVPELLRHAKSPGRSSTWDWRNPGGLGNSETSHDQVITYCEYFLRVLGSVTSARSTLGAVVYQCGTHLPWRMAAIHLDYEALEGKVVIEQVSDQCFVDQLMKFTRFLSHQAEGEFSFFTRRVATIFDAPVIDGKRRPTVYIVKPDQVRFWTRGAALKDADALVAGGMPWDASADYNSSGAKEVADV